MAALDLNQYQSLLESRGVEVVSCDDGFIVIRHLVGGQETELSIRFKGRHAERFPYQLPAVFLRNRDRYGLLAHVSWPDENNEGFICLGTSEGYSLDFAHPELVLEGLVEDAVALLEKTLLDPQFNREESLREFSGHWRQAAPAGLHLLYLNDSPDEMEELKLALPEKNKTLPISGAYCVYGADYGGVLKGNFLVKSIGKRGRQRQGRAFKFSLPVLPLPPGPGEALNEWLEVLCRAQGHPYEKKLRRYARQHQTQNACLVFEAEGEGFKARFAVLIRSLSKRALPLGAGLGEGWKIEALNVDSCTRDYLLPRGGASEALADKKIVLFGCGSVGSVIAEQLAALGIGKLTLIDPELLTLDNLYRHTLGIEHTYRYKADSLRIVLQSKYPFSDIAHHHSTLMDAEEAVFCDADLLILATGDLTSERGFHERLRLRKISVPTVTTWLEPFGVGGHVIFSPNDLGEGCYTCAFVRRDDPELLALTPNLSFIAEDQDVPIIRAVGSCAGEFLPYSKLDATRTATLAMRSVAQFLSGRSIEAQTSSWCEPLLKKELEERGVRYTQRFLNHHERETSERLYSETCPCCGKYK